jgi:hypothetical protein
MERPGGDYHERDAVLDTERRHERASQGRHGELGSLPRLPGVLAAPEHPPEGEEQHAGFPVNRDGRA